MNTPPTILFVCLGNICRSPTAEAVFKQRALQAGLKVMIESAGTSGWHIGEPPDPRAVEHGEKQGYDFTGMTGQSGTDGFEQVIDLIERASDGLITHLKSLQI